MTSLKANKSKIIIAVVCVIAVISIIFYFNQDSKAAQSGPIGIDPAFSAYISTYTGGIVSASSSIIIRFHEPLGDGMSVKNLLEFSPGIKGASEWTDTRTLEFTPTEKMAQGQRYVGKLNLGKLLEVPEQHKVFEFSFQTIAQDFEFEITGHQFPDPQDISRIQVMARMVTADLAESDQVLEMVKASHQGKSLAIKTNTEGPANDHIISIEGIQRGGESGKVDVTVRGNPLGIKRDETISYSVPAVSQFILVNSRVNQREGQHILLQFSDPLDADQNLNGLITIEDVPSLTFQINQNEVKVLPPIRQTGEKNIKISPGIRNIKGNRLDKGVDLKLNFEQLPPQVKFIGKGTILPSTEGLVMPFEAVNLRAVEVTVIQIYEQNMLQFLQVNHLSGNSELRRVGKPIMKKLIPLEETGVLDLGKWNRFTLDLSQLIQADQGALYQIRIGFKKEHTAFFCDGAILEPIEMTDLEISFEDDFDRSWDSYSEYYYHPEYNWRERNNPCHVSYYNQEKEVQKNILASDLGIVAKRGNDGSLLALVTDLKTASPISGAEITIYDYQGKILGKEKTKADGTAHFQLENRTFVLIGKFKDQTGYLKMDDGSSIPLSNFDVRGDPVQKGTKGFIYGERGAWRPGDTLHLTFMLNRNRQPLPSNHPVSFELINARGQTVYEVNTTRHVGGFYRFSVPTNEDDPTGNWMAKVRAGGAEFTKSLMVEAIKPNRLKIKLDFGKERLSVTDQDITGRLQVNWLSGAPANGLKAEFSMMLSPTTTTFEGYPGYTFDDPSRTFYPEQNDIFDGYVNSQGEARVNTQIFVDGTPPGALKATFSGRVYEDGGNFSIDQFTIPYYPFNSFVGITTPEGDRQSDLLVTDTDHIAQIVTLSADGKPLNNQNIDLTLQKISWRWWWDSGDDYLGHYTGSSQSQIVSRGRVQSSNGKATWKFRVDQPEWGRYLIRACDTESGHCTGKVIYIDWPGWAGRDRRDIPGGATMLSFSSDKTTYEVGEMAKISIPGSKNGKAFITIENGSRVLESHWINTEADENRFTFKVTESMAPNVYVSAMLIQEHAQTSNDLPSRLFGVIPIKVENPATHLDPVIGINDVLKPGEKVNITVKEKSGKAMAYTLAVIDEGLLDITKFKTPDPWSTFYAREGLGVKTWDIFEYVIGAYGGRLERIISIGGDMEMLMAEEDQNLKSNRFRPVVVYMGPFELKKGGTNSHQFTMPQYVGAVRTMVVAGSPEAFGNSEKSSKVKQPLMVLSTLPRVLGPGETFQLPVTVFADDNSVKSAKIKLKTNAMLKIKGPSEKQVQFRTPGEQIIYFEVEVAKALGNAVAEIEATSGINTAVSETDVLVRNPNPRVSRIENKIVAAGASWEAAIPMPGMKGTNKAVLEVSSIPPIDFSGRLQYLTGFPHGCLEQTISKVFPQLYLSEVTPLDQAQKENIESNIKAGIEKLANFQINDGGFAYWPGNENSNSWATSYTGHFLLEAQKKGYHLPSGLLSNWQRFQKSQARNWRPSEYHNSDLMQAYRLYTLALAGAPDMGAMNRMRESGNMSMTAAWRLAAAYSIAGQKQAALDLVAGMGTHVPKYREMSYTYGSNVRDQAMILETLALLGEKEKGFLLVQELSKIMSDPNQWMSTQTTAYCLIGVGAYLKESGTTGQIHFDYQVPGAGNIEAKTDLPIAVANLPDDVSGKLSFKNRTEAPLFVRIVAHGLPEEGMEETSSNDLSMSVRYYDKNGTAMNPASIIQGTDFIAEVTVRHPGHRSPYKEMALTQIFPSGWEILNTRVMGDAVGAGGDTPDYQDVRDDRVLTYFDLGTGQQKTFRIMLNASYAGTFYLPGISCEAMYDNTVNATEKGRRVTVSPGPGSSIP